jgi:hypothetical protein
MYSARMAVTTVLLNAEYCCDSCVKMDGVNG